MLNAKKRSLQMMYAVIETGGKQYRVSHGEKLKIELLPVQEGDEFNFDKILMIAEDSNIQVGKPYVEKARVAAKVVRHGRGDKIRIVKMRRRKNSRRINGHRQHFTEVEITSISA